MIELKLVDESSFQAVLDLKISEADERSLSQPEEPEEDRLDDWSWLAPTEPIDPIGPH